MKKTAVILFMSVCLCLSVSSQQSLLSQATNGLFTNANDWIIGPNDRFNSVNKDYLIIAGAFNGAAAGGGTELGYYHAGPVPFGISANFDFLSDKHLTKEEAVTGSTNTTITTTYENPAFNSWAGTVRATVGFPWVLNLSVGAVVSFNGNANNGFRTVRTTSVNGSVISETVSEYKTSDYGVTLSIPVGLRIGPVYNLAVPVFSFGGSSTEGGGISDASSSHFSFFMYDKAVFFTLIPGGTETAVWAGAGTAPTAVAQLEVPAFGSVTDKTTNGQAGISNRIDFTPVGGITISLNPKFYIDWLLGNNGSYRVGYTIASDVGLYARIPGIPLAVFFGMTPRLTFWHGMIADVRDTGSTHTTVTYAEGKLGTDILWSGRFGLSMLFPNDMSFDLTCNVNTSNAVVNLSAQMTIHL